MPKINPIEVRARAENAELYFRRDYECHVLADGTFQMIVPDDDYPVFERLNGGMAGSDYGQAGETKADKKCFRSPLRDNLQKLANLFGDLQVDTEIEESLLIFYSLSEDIAYCTSPDFPGEVFPDGNKAGPKYEWANATKGGQQRVDYSVGLSATIVGKRIHRQKLTGAFYVEHFRPVLTEGTYGEKLQSFVRTVWPSLDFWSAGDPTLPKHRVRNETMNGYRVGGSLQCVPYTEESAKFFYDMMMNLCKLHAKLTDFFGSTAEDLLENLNDPRKQMLLGHQKD